jgi:hypothetical protein
MDPASFDVPRPGFACAPHVSHGTLPAGLVVRFMEPARGTLELANWLVGPVYEQLDQRYPRHNALTLVLDLELMTSRTSASRTVFLAKAKQCGWRFTRSFFVPPRRTTAAQRHAIRVGIAIVQALGVPVETVDSLERAIHTADLRAAP